MSGFGQATGPGMNERIYLAQITIPWQFERTVSGWPLAIVEVSGDARDSDPRTPLALLSRHESAGDGLPYRPFCGKYL